MDLLKRFPMIAVGTLAAAILAACGGEAAGGGPQYAIVDTVIARGEDVPEVVTAIGTVEADNQTAVSAEVAGQVARIYRDEGSVVGQGTPILQLNPSPYAYGVESASASVAREQVQLENDERLLERYESLLAAGAIDQQTYDDLEAKVGAERAAARQAQAALNTARWDLGRATVRAPFAGTVGKRHVELGQYVDAQDPLFEIVDAQPVKIRFSVPEIHVDEIAVGDAVEFRVTADTVAVRIAQIDYVSPQIDPDTRSFEVTAEYSNPDQVVRPGAFADVSVTTSTIEDAAIVPEEALYTEGQTNYAYVVKDSTAERREIRVVRRMEGAIAIAQGVEPGETVIVAGHHGLPSGAPVQIPAAEPKTIERED